MSEKDDAPDLLDDYFQLGEPVNSYQPGENKQKVDLTEYYKETGQDDATVMVMGTEELNFGKLSRRTAILLKLKRSRAYDPFPTERNARMGAEGLITTIVDGFKTFIETIIKYIRMAIDWVVDTIKGIFGFRKSARIEKAIDDNLDAMKKEFEATLLGLGFPVSEYNVEKFVGELKPGQDRKLQLVMLKNKLEGDKEAIDGLGKSLPILVQAMAKIKQANEKLGVKTKALKKAISDEFSRTRVRHATNNPVSGSASTEVLRVLTACQEVKLALDVNSIAESVGALYNTLYGIEFTNDELTNGFTAVRSKLQSLVKTESVKLTPQKTSEIFLGIQYLNARYQELSDNEIDLSKVDWRALGQVIDKGDADRVNTIANYFGATNQLLPTYQETTVAVRNYTQFCFNITQALLIIEKQISNLVEWHRRCHAYYYAGVIGDVETVVNMVKEARAKGHNPLANGFDVPVGMVYIREADAKTLGEKAAANINFIITEDIAGVKTSLNNFSRQIGWGNLV